MIYFEGQSVMGSVYTYRLLFVCLLKRHNYSVQRIRKGLQIKSQLKNIEQEVRRDDMILTYRLREFNRFNHNPNWFQEIRILGELLMKSSVLANHLFSFRCSVLLL